MPVFLPRRWNRQPTQLTDVNVSTGLTQGLVFLFNGAFPNIDHTKTYRAVSGRVNTFDLQGVFSTGAGDVSLLQSDVSRTVLVIGRNLAAAPAVTTPLINAGTAGVGGWMIQILTNNLTLRWTDLTKADLTFGATTYSAVSQTRQYCVVRDRGSANNARLYNQNGVLQATVAGSTYATITKTIAIENAGAALVVVWQRALSDLEITEVSRNPWQLFRPAANQTFYSLPSQGASTQTLTDVGNIASAEAFGTAALAPGAVTVTNAGAIASSETFGDAVVSAGGTLLSAVGDIASAEAFGTATLVPGAVSVTSAGAISSAEAFGTATLSVGATLVTGAGNIASAETFGAALITSGGAVVTGAGNISSAETFGSSTVARGAVSVTNAGAISSAETFGNASLARGAVTLSSAGAIASAEAFGDPLIAGAGVFIQSAGGIASAEAFGLVPLIPQAYVAPDVRALEVLGGGRILEVAGGRRTLEVQG